MNVGDFNSNHSIGFNSAKSPTIEKIQQMVQGLDALGGVFSTHIRLFQKELAPYQRALLQFEETLRPAMEVARVATRALRAYENPELSKLLQELHRGWKAFEEWESQLSNRLDGELCFIPPFLHTLTLPDLSRLFAENESAISALDTYFGIPQNIHDLRKAWQHDPMFAPRIEILGEALQNHLDRRYASSITVFLSQIDGILAELLGVTKYKKYAELMRKKIPSKKPGSVRELVGLHNLPEILERHLFLDQSRKSITETVYPNRHRILHGQDTSFASTPYLSVRCIIFLDSLRSPELRPELKETQD
jgi:uncharacterized short protein YbdD (DUF466 family)